MITPLSRFDNPAALTFDLHALLIQTSAGSRAGHAGKRSPIIPCPPVQVCARHPGKAWTLQRKALSSCRPESALPSTALGSRFSVEVNAPHSSSEWQQLQDFFDICDTCLLQKDEGKIVLAGALTDPVDSALFIWKNASQEVETRFSICSSWLYIHNREAHLLQTSFPQLCIAMCNDTYYL